MSAEQMHVRTYGRDELTESTGHLPAQSFSSVTRGRAYEICPDRDSAVAA